MHKNKLRTLFAYLALAASAGCAHAVAESHTAYGLGHAPTAAELAKLDIDVAPDGTGLPAGRGDAVDGAPIFAMACSSCHGTAIRLDPQRWRYATTLFDYVRRAMPPGHVHSLGANELYAITAYELNVNGTLQLHELLDRTSLERVKMPGADNFTEQP